MDARETVIRAAADLHGELPEIEPCDLLVLTGDLAPRAVETDLALARNWFSTEFAAWIDAARNRDLRRRRVGGSLRFW